MKKQFSVMTFLRGVCYLLHDIKTGRSNNNGKVKATTYTLSFFYG